MAPVILMLQPLMSNVLRPESRACCSARKRTVSFPAVRDDNVRFVRDEIAQMLDINCRVSSDDKSLYLAQFHSLKSIATSLKGHPGALNCFAPSSPKMTFSKRMR